MVSLIKQSCFTIIGCRRIVRGESCEGLNGREEGVREGKVGFFGTLQRNLLFIFEATGCFDREKLYGENRVLMDLRGEATAGIDAH